MIPPIPNPAWLPSLPPSIIQRLMTYDPGKTVNHSGTDPDKGMKTRPYLKMVAAALFLLLAVVFFIARSGSHSAPPIKSGTTSSGESQPATAPQ